MRKKGLKHPYPLKNQRSARKKQDNPGVLKAARVFEYLVYLICTAVISLGNNRAALFTFSMPEIVAVIAGVGSLITFIIVGKVNHAVFTSMRALFLLSLAIIYIIHGTVSYNPATTVYSLSSLFIFYYCLAIMYGTIGSLPQLLTLYGILILGEYSRFVIQFIYGDHVSLVMGHIFTLSPHIGLVFGSGLLAFMVSPRPSDHPQVVTKVVGFDDSFQSAQDTEKASDEVVTAESVKKEAAKGAAPVIAADELNSVVFFMFRNFTAYSALGFIYDAQREIFTLNSYKTKSMSIVSHVQIPKGRGVIGNLAVDRITFLSGNLTNYEQKLEYYPQQEIIHSILAAPIISTDNELLGALVVDNKDKLAFRDNHRDIMMRFSNIAGALITNVRMRMLKEKVAYQFQTYYDAAQQFTSVTKTNDVYNIVFEKIGFLHIPYTRIVAIDYNFETSECFIRKVMGAQSWYDDKFVFSLNDGVYSQAIRNKKRILVDDLRKIKQFYFKIIPNEPRDQSIRSFVIYPIANANSVCSGIIALESINPNQFGGEVDQVLSTLISNASVAYEKVYLFNKMENLATTDGLTQLKNHRTFQNHLQDEIGRSQRSNRPFSLIIMDIDHFKKFNDTYGHTTGDLVLKEMATCIKKSIRSIDIAARYGGEEFAIIIPETNAQGAYHIAERVRSNVEAIRLKVRDQILHVTVSIGCATYPIDTQDKKQFIECADSAMYHSKEHGRNRVTVYNNKIKSKHS